MSIFGIGGLEFVLILLIALIVAGPKRLAVWAYQMGVWASKLQELWGVFASSLQKEMDEAGVQVQVPRNPTRDQITRSVQEFGREIVKKAEAPVKDLKEDVEQVKREFQAESNAISRGVTGNGTPRADAKHKPAEAPPPETDDASASEQDEETTEKTGFGTWAGE